ncbi:Aldo-keto reductase family 1 member B10, partial [Fasciola gigantica]
AIFSHAYDIFVLFHFLTNCSPFLNLFFSGLINRLAFVHLLSATSLFGVQAMESLVDKGLVKAIGLSNFNRRQIEEIWRHSRIKPTNLQIEVHSNFPNAELVDFAQSLGMTVTAYAPLGSPGGFRYAFILVVFVFLLNFIGIRLSFRPFKLFHFIIIIGSNSLSSDALPHLIYWGLTWLSTASCRLSLLVQWTF